MFVVLYSWRIDPSLEEQFTESWSAVTRHYLEHHGSLGSRLHRGGDGRYYAYAKWPDESSRDAAANDGIPADLRSQMNAAILEAFPEITLEVVADYLKI
ncbi:MAG: antibiotic biosynthesis monooxygenase [Acidobacteriota bacterium]|nr:MAG: antibiotic biosynthesis monooxygenase [Acidobacteriota bacterium]